MSYEIALLPSGRLAVRDGGGDGDTSAGRWIERATKAFGESPPAGLFALAASRPDAPPPPAFGFWREFACRFLADLCQTPEGAGARAVPPPVVGDLEALAAAAPPMEGGEYLRPAVLERVWSDLDAWVRDAVGAAGGDLAAWLKDNAPAWHQVGRVCFHLAENKRDPDCPFAFMATYAPRLSRSGQVEYQPLSRALEEFAGERKSDALVRLLSPVHRASERSEFVKELVDTGDVFHPLAWTPADAYRLLKDVPVLEESGLLVRLPDWWRARPRPRVAVTVGEGSGGDRFSPRALLDFNVELALDGQALTQAEVDALLAGGDGLVLLRGRWVEVDRERLTEALDHWQRVEREAARKGISFVEGMRLLAGAPADLSPQEAAAAGGDRTWSMVKAGAWLGAILADLRDPDRVAGLDPGRDLRGTLRQYQATGVRWLHFLARLGLGACLADDMGLGKTIQVLSLLLALKREGGETRRPALLVVPASLVANWRAEMERFAPTLTVRFIHPSEIAKDDLAAIAADPRRALASVDAVVTTYGMLLRQEWLAEVEWGLVVIDEAQAIKNPAARQSRAVKELKGQARIALTGTPVENRLTDLWSLFDFLCPGLLGSAKRFGEFVKALNARPHEPYAPLRNLVRPYILRRLKTDKAIIADLPEKTEVKAFCGLTKKQAALYGAAVADLARALEGLDGMKRRGVVLSALMRFKQICNHPSHYLGDGAYESAASGKFERLRELGEEIASRQERALVFTQFRELTEPLAAFLAEIFGRPGIVLHGGTAVGRRKALVDAFQGDDGPPFFVLSLKAGGIGLNLTAAAHVIHFDRWWNPAVENQATDRAFRIGQKKNVLVHKFICRGTVEERIDALIEDKRALARDIVEGGAETLLSEMGDKELLAIVALDVEKARL